MADPSPILHTLITNPDLARRYRVEATLVTIDGAAGQNTLDSHHESVKQAAMGDRLLLTKADLVAPEELESLQERLLEINPAAEQIVVANGELSANEILDQVAFDSQGKLADVRRWINENAYQRVAEWKVGGQAFLRARANKAGRSSAHDDGIRAFCFTVDKPVSPERFDSWLNALMSLLGQNMLRMKGILNIEGRPRPMVVHGVQHIFHPPIYLPDWPSDDHRSRLVCITRNISRRVIEGSFDKLVSLNSDSKWDAV
jgi:G3E family GTPase